jgi:N-acetylated-alpha-linked acidic dipeptidase
MAAPYCPDALTHLKRPAKVYDAAVADAVARGVALMAAQRSQLDTVRRGLEQALTSDEGLPGCPGYKHLIYAPGLYTGYGAKTLPGVREAIEQRHWDETLQYISISARAIESYCDRLDAATALLRD